MKNKEKVLELLQNLWSDLGDARDNPEDSRSIDLMQRDVLQIRDLIEKE